MSEQEKAQELVDALNRIDKTTLETHKISYHRQLVALGYVARRENGTWTLARPAFDRNNTLGCHGSSVICQEQEVGRIDETTATMIVHNIREMHSDGSLMGFIHDEQKSRRTVMLAPVWDKWYEQK